MTTLLAMTAGALFSAAFVAPYPYCLAWACLAAASVIILRTL